MNDYKVGDKVVLTHIDGSVLMAWVQPGGFESGHIATHHEEWFKKFGWSVTKHEPKVELPTDEGAYVDKYGHDVWTITSFHGLMCVANSSSNAEKYAPFTRLEPVPETAAKVLTWLEEHYMLGGETVLASFTTAREHFGVTS